VSNLLIYKRHRIEGTILAVKSEMNKTTRANDYETSCVAVFCEIDLKFGLMKL
jgi:hypothetical protein